MLNRRGRRSPSTERNGGPTVATKKKGAKKATKKKATKKKK